jgi:small subunit ribosomal protein S9
MPTKIKKTVTKVKAVKKIATKKVAAVHLEHKVVEHKVEEPIIKIAPVHRIVNNKFILATGKRKTSVARVKFFIEGTGEISVNGKPFNKYFSYFDWQKTVERPLLAAGWSKKGTFDIKVRGGGIMGQAEAASLGIARALVALNVEVRKALKPLGLLSRDSRKKERKKPGLKRARRAPQWTKR